MRAFALSILVESDPTAKAIRAMALPRDAAAVEVGAREPIVEPIGVPGRPDRPLLVAPAQLSRRDTGSKDGRAALIHSLAHIEFNAINLALDAAWRFDGLPDAFYLDWVRVAADEAKHFLLLVEHLKTFGHRYGDFVAHDGLWEMAERTKGDVLARVALVPRTLEARGLDASPRIRSRLASEGDARGAAILDIILADEIEHVAIGNRWYRCLCAERRLDPDVTYAQLASTYGAPVPKGPFNHAARLAAGFTEAELAALRAAHREGRRATDRAGNP